MVIKTPQLLTVKEAAYHLRVHASTIYRMLKRGSLPAFKVGSDWRIDVEELDKLTASGGTFPAGGVVEHEPT